ncbi:MAG: hypothetical protein EAZ85_05740 [Bacteroidetes bacterium]|nr:MAG: hypothetical protein EAZ85_05740 [Bacteroidota bacterium]TAG89162.1 MAG: hypothetical protein EAZ20_07020 [Bacteroidota bacterium]
MQKILLFFFLFLVVNTTFAQKKTTISSPDEVLRLESRNDVLHLENSKVPLLEDITGTLNIEDVIKSTNKNKFVLTKYDQYELHPQSVYWMRLRLENASNVDEDWILYLGRVTNADVYVPQHTGKYDVKKTGQLVKTRDKDIKTGRYNTVELFLPAKGGVIDIYIRFQNKIEFSPDPNVRLYPKPQWQEKIILDNLMQGFFQGLLWMMLFYNFILLFVLMDKTYLYYVLYIFTTSIYFLNFYGYTSEFIVGDYPYFDYVYLPFMAHVGFIAYMFFMRSYLQTHREMPLWDTLIKIVTAIFTALLIALIALASFDYSSYIVVERIFYGIIQAILLIMLIFILTMGEKPARYFAFGTLLMIGGGLLLFLGASGIVKLQNNILYYQLGVIGQIFVFSLGLTERYKKIEDDKHDAERSLIIQLQENEKLHTKVKRELEDKVKQRTYEIERKNQEITEQSQEIQAQRDAVALKNSQVEHINKEIKHSINYASRIQVALFDDVNEIEGNFKEAFIMLRPKDIVSGDFYWYSEVVINQPSTQNISMDNKTQEMPNHSIFPYSLQKEDSNVAIDVDMAKEYKKKIFIVADCTGHGVPGAFMTVMGYSILHEIVDEKNIYEPDEILYELDKQVIKNLKKGNTDNQVQDGMEITVMVYDEFTNTITYSAAGNPLYLVRNFDIQTYPASSHSIGFSKKTKQKVFEKISIPVLEDDVFYMTTDGFQDQFGGTENKKYMKKNMREFLLRISHLPLSEQKEKIKEEIINWQGNEVQTDDILLAGVKF